MKPTWRPSVSSARNRDVLMNTQSPYKWWSTLKSDVSGLSSSLPQLVAVVAGPQLSDRASQLP